MYQWSEMIKRAGSPPEAADSAVEPLPANWVAHMGPWFLGLVALTFMLAVQTTQTMNYFSTFGFESLWLFLLVVSCALLSIGQWLTIVTALWDSCIQNYGDWRRLGEFSWRTVASPLTMGLTVFTSQLFFASRCYTLYGRSKLVFGILLLGMTASLGLFLGLAAMVATEPLNSPTIAKMMLSALVINVATDLAITGLTLWKIGRGRKTYSLQTQRGLQRLRNTTAETAMPPTITMILNVGLHLIMGKRNHISVLFAIITPPLYVWSMMYTLNSRIAIRQTFNTPNYAKDETLSTGVRFTNLEAANGSHKHADMKEGTAVLTTIPEPPLVTKRSIHIPLEHFDDRVDPKNTQSSGATLNEEVV